MVGKTETIKGGQSDTLLSAWLGDLSHAARRHPDTDAVIGDGACLTRVAVERGVCVLARQLRESGITAGARVVVCLDRSPFTIVAFLAVLRVGGVYVPIDPHYPSARVAAMLECGPGALITTPSIQIRLPAISCPVLLAGQSVGEDSTAAAEIDPVADAQPAYMMFTSGSTGASFAVIVSRGALARYAAALRDAFRMPEADVCLHTASFSFSASIRQMISPLTAGARMVIAGEEARHDPFRLLDLMRQHEVTVWDTVPSLWRIVERVVAKTASQNEAGLLPDSLRLILLTGEPLPWALVRAWKRHLHGTVEIFNLYSQTETVGTVSMFPIPAGDVPEMGNVPLGRPLPGVELLVLDEDLNPATPGHEGEVCIASDRLAEGYHGLDDLTARRFLFGLDADGASLRLFRTGDFVRIGADGSLIPVGRRDHRVKIRGFRVDLLEIESALIEDRRIDQAVVLAEAFTRLVAYVVPAKGQCPDPAGIQNRLRQKLPDHAVPGQVIITEQIPLTANGKVDRGALERLRDRAPAVKADEPAVADATEAALLRIWEQSLAYNGAGLDDDFFERGGDSLTAVSLFLEIEDHFAVRLPPSTLLTAGSPRRLAALIRQTPDSIPNHSVLALRISGSLPPLFLVHAIWEHIPHFRELVKLLDPDLPVFALEPIRNPQAVGRRPDMGELVKQYARDIRKTHPAGPFFLAGWSIGGVMAFSVAAEMEARGDQPAGLLLIDAASPSLRPEVRRHKARGLASNWQYLRTLAARQIRSFRLSPRQQWERLAWVYREVARRLCERARSPASRQHRMQMLDDFSRLVDQHQSPPCTSPVVLFRSEQPAVDAQQDEDLGWRQHVHGDLEIIRLPGDHISIVIEPYNMALLAARISAIVNREAGEQASRRGREMRDDQQLMDTFLAETQKLSGQKYAERQPWISTVTKDAIRHFSSAICDDNPLWTDGSHATGHPAEPGRAPPGILIAARYPVLHGAPLDVPLISLLKSVEYSWERDIHEGEELQSSTEQGDVRDIVDPAGNRRIHIKAHTTYWNGRGQVLGRATGTVVRMLSQGRFEAVRWSIYRYSPDELERIIEDIHSEVRTGSRRLTENEFVVGTNLPGIVRGPLTIGDMVCWHSGIGPSYRPGPLGYKDTLEAPQFRVRNPITGWPIKYMLQHEDVNLAHQRGMPAPFDNGVMRFAWVTPLVTNWMGNAGFLSRLYVNITLPVFYGDTCWYSGEVTARSREVGQWRVRIRLSGVNQHGVITTTGSAEVLLPSSGQVEEG